MLGLISSTSQGAEILDDYNWEATLSPLGMPTGLCIPSDVDKFISVSNMKIFQSPPVDKVWPMRSDTIVEPTHPTNQRQSPGPAYG